jgi:hypothetical protein
MTNQNLEEIHTARRANDGSTIDDLQGIDRSGLEYEHNDDQN